ncbi:MAG: galactose mutarotase [Clostridia bacterium]|nr:galactose mutarotase [Clostridia bacterium]
MELFGVLPSGESIYKFTLRSAAAEAEIISYGAAIRSFSAFGRDIVGGSETLGQYLTGHAYFGTTVGRVCNRIVGGRLVIDGETVELTKNNGEHCLHGGTDGYHNKPWEVISHTPSSVTLGYLSPDGQSGFPGNLKITARFCLEGSRLSVIYRAVSDKKTPVMLTSHGFFNLSSFERDVLSSRAIIYADEVTEVDEKRLPTGRHIPVKDSFLDFTSEHSFGERIEESPVGYDHNYILKPTVFSEVEGIRVGLAAEVRGEGLCLKAYTNQPGMQLYVMKNPPKSTPTVKNGRALLPNGAFCLEAQIEPDCVSRGIGFIDAGEEYVSAVAYEISCD